LPTAASNAAQSRNTELKRTMGENAQLREEARLPI
jgi:hypothetical protein